MSKLGKNIKGRLYEYFKARLGMFDYRNGWMKGDCPDCGAHNKYGVNISHNRTNCFKCGYHERPIYVVRMVENFKGLSEVYNMLNAFDGFSFKETKVERIERKPVILPEGFRLLNQGNSQMAKSARSYMKGRGFDIDKLSAKGFGYCTSGDYFGHIIMPFFAEGKMVYFHARNFLNTGPKFNNPPMEEFGVGKSTLIYNQDALFIYDRIFIVESVMNAETLEEAGTVLGGKKISNYQYSIIVNSPVEKIVILLDPDAYSEALQLGMRLSNHKKVKVVLLPDDNDVNDIGRKKTLEYVREIPYENYNQLLLRKMAYERSQFTYH